MLRALSNIGSLLCLATLAGCAALPGAPEQAKEKHVAAKAECVKPASLTPGNPQDDAVQRRFVAVCSQLGREPDLNFGADISTYYCGVNYSSGAGAPFPPDVWKENEERRSKLAEMLKHYGRTLEPRGNLIGVSGGRLGWGHVLLLLADKDGQVVSVLAMRSELKRQLAVKSPRAAASLVSLSKTLPEMERLWLCEGSVYQEADSWVFPSLMKNCEQIERDVRVGFDGRISFGPDRATQRKICGAVD